MCVHQSINVDGQRSVRKQLWVKEAVPLIRVVFLVSSGTGEPS